MTEIYMTSFCNFGHRMSDGKPINHECYVIPPALLKAERDGSGEIEKVLEKWSDWYKNKKSHRGVKANNER